MTLFHGTLSGLLLSEAVIRLAPSFPRGWICVVRSIDSERGREAIEWCLSHYGIPSLSQHENVIVDGSTLSVEIVERVFTGFDEVWVISGAPPESKLDAVSRCTSDSTQFSDGIPEDVAEMMRACSCLLVLGDGCGLNYLTVQAGFAATLESMK